MSYLSTDHQIVTSFATCQIQSRVVKLDPSALSLL